MPDDEPAQVGLDSILDRLRETVEERRRSGQYPPQLELDLDQHFERIVGLHPAGLSLLQRRMEEVERASQISRDRIITSSSLPGGALVHRGIGKLVSRQTDSIISQLRWFAGSVRETMELIVDQLAEVQPSGRQSDLIDLTARVDGILERLAAYDRAADTAQPEFRGLSARLDRLEAEARFSRFPAGPRQTSMDNFMGERSQVIEAWRLIAKRFEGKAPVLVVGSGRGEMLEVLAERRIEARGVESDDGLVASTRERGLTVTLAFVADYIHSVPDESLGGIFLGYTAETLTPQELSAIVSASVQKLRSGGSLVSQSLNPASLYAMARVWYQDPARYRPVPAEYLVGLMEDAGFAAVETEFLNPPPTGEQLELFGDRRLADGAAEVLDRNFARLNRLIYAPRDYIVVATR